MSAAVAATDTIVGDNGNNAAVRFAVARFESTVDELLMLVTDALPLCEPFEWLSLLESGDCDGVGDADLLALGVVDSDGVTSSRDDVAVGVGDADPMECVEETETERDTVALNEKAAL